MKEKDVSCEKYENAAEVPVEVCCKAAASLEEEVEKELKVEDPAVETAKAVLSNLKEDKDE